MYLASVLIINDVADNFDVIESEWHQLKSHEIAGQMFDNEYDLALAIIAGVPSNVLYLKVRK